VAYSASPGTYILTGSADRSVRLYNPGASGSSAGSDGPPAGRLIQTFSGHGYEVLSLAVAADNARFCSAGGDRALFLWDVESGTTLRRFGGMGVGGHASRINSVAFAGADDMLVVSGGFDTTVRVWDCKSGNTKPIMVLSEARDSVSAVAVGDAEIVAGSVDGRVRTYDVRMGRLTTDVLGGSVTSLCLSRDARTLLVGTLDSKVRLMDRENGTCLRTYRDDGWRNEELRVQSVLGGSERFVLAGDELTGESTTEGRVWAWDLLTGKLIARVPVPWNDTKRRAIGRDGKEKERKNVISCMAWKEGGYGDQFCVGGTSGIVTVFGN
jgi:mitogen-activated protein kinase organizer 1